MPRLQCAPALRSSEERGDRGLVATGPSPCARAHTHLAMGLLRKLMGKCFCQCGFGILQYYEVVPPATTTAVVSSGRADATQPELYRPPRGPSIAPRWPAVFFGAGGRLPIRNDVGGLPPRQRGGFSVIIFRSAPLTYRKLDRCLQTDHTKPPPAWFSGLIPRRDAPRGTGALPLGR